MSMNSKRGAARVSAVWMIVMVVLFLAAIFFAYTQAEQAANFESAAASARAERELALIREQEALNQARAITEGLGFNDESVIGSVADPSAVRAGLERLREVFPVGENTTRFAQAIDPMIAAFRARLDEIQTLNGRIADLQSQKKALEENLAQVQRSKDEEIQDLRTQLTDVTNAAQEERTNLEGRIAEIQRRRDDLDSQLRAERTRLDDEQRARAQDRLDHSTRANHLTRVLEFQREPEQADGSVLEVSKQLGVGYIDLGAKHRLQRGMSFQVVSGAPNSDRMKGVAEVVEVLEDMAQVRFTQITDPYFPIVPGDVIYNPLYDPRGERNAVLLGRFTGAYNESELRMLLEEIGIHVQPTVDSETDYLIVGSALYRNEDGEALEEPIEPSELPEYKQAEFDGVRIVPIREVRRFFKK